VQISIELNHQPKSALKKDVEDTWTLKIKHTPKPFYMQRNGGSLCYNNEVPLVNKSPKSKKSSWRNIIHAAQSDAEETNFPIFNKFRRSAKSRKGKSWRQLLKQRGSREVNATTTSLDETVMQPVLQQPPVLRQDVQEDEQMRVAFSRLDNDTSQKRHTDEAFQELNETQWGNVAAVMLDHVANRSIPVDGKLNQQTNWKEISFIDSSADRKGEVLMGTDALALELSAEGNDSEPDKGIISLHDRRGNKIAHARNYKKEARNRTEGGDANEDEEKNWRKATENVEAAGNLNGEQHTDVESDYVIEDPTVREYDKEVLDLENYYDIMGDGGGDSEPTPEMKRIMDWFPRSKLLTTENNGYKLFPGVSSRNECNIELVLHTNCRLSVASPRKISLL
jgi:hypothetical protein